MHADLPCETLQFAATTRLEVCNSPRRALIPGTPEGDRLLARLGLLASEAGGTGYRLQVGLESAGRAGWTADLGLVGRGGSRHPGQGGSSRLEEDPLATPGMLRLTLFGADPHMARLRVEMFSDNLRDGFAKGSPALVWAGPQGFEVAYFHKGTDVTAAVRHPIGSIRETPAVPCATALPELLIDPCHARVVEILTLAERNGEAVTVSAAGYPGLHRVRAPGRETYVLMDGRTLAGHAAAWAAQGTPVNSARVSLDTRGNRCSLVRTVGGRVDGCAPETPGCCSSTLPGNGAPAEFVYALSIAGSRVGRNASDTVAVERGIGMVRR